MVTVLATISGEASVGVAFGSTDIASLEEIEPAKTWRSDYTQEAKSMGDRGSAT
jgi:hypothetical protein